MINFILIIAFILFSEAAYSIEKNQNCNLKMQYHKELITKNSNLSKKYTKEIKQLERVVNNLGCTLTKIEVPPGRSFILMQQGKIDVMIAITKTTERETFMHFIGPHGNERNFVVGPNRKKFTIAGISDLERSRLTLSATQGAFYGYGFEKLIEKSNFRDKVIFTTTNNQKLDLFMKGRVELTIENEYVISDMIQKGIFKKNGISKLFLIDESPIYFAFSKASISNEFAQKLQESWENIK